MSASNMQDMQDMQDMRRRKAKVQDTVLQIKRGLNFLISGFETCFAPSTLRCWDAQHISNQIFGIFLTTENSYRASCMFPAWWFWSLKVPRATMFSGGLRRFRMNQSFLHGDRAIGA